MEPLRKIVTGEDETKDSNPWLHNALSLLAVHVVGLAGWFVSYEAGAWDGASPGAPDAPKEAKTPLEAVGLTLGYFSAVLYLWYVHVADDTEMVANQCAVPEFPRSSRTTAKSLARVSRCFFSCSPSSETWRMA